MYMNTVNDDVVYIREEYLEDMSRTELFEHLNLVGELFTEELSDFDEDSLRERALDHFNECRYTFVNNYYQQKRFR